MVSGDDRKPRVNPPGSARGQRHKLLGRPENPNAPPRVPVQPIPQGFPGPRSSRPAAAKTRVLFVCIGNSCRSQVAEAFARAYGSDVMEAHSAGVSPATMIAPQTAQVLAEWNLPSDNLFPKGLEVIRHRPFDLVVNMSGMPVTLPGTRMVEWTVPDPMGQRDVVHREVAQQLEALVMRLILELRTAAGR
jgi:arsenate reductase (thioredoxin)